jgi:hypothetical protein
LQQFNPEQVEAYVRKWFSLDESIVGPRKTERANSFLQNSEFVQDLRVNPLMLSLMCGIYSSENYIPRNRPDVYEKCALLLFDSWDKQRGIKAPLSFDAHVQAAMRSLALWLYPRQEAQKGLPRAQLIDYMTQYLRKKRFDQDEDAEQAATEFIDFCKGRAWVLTDVGAELYGFTHRTFLEYFAARQLAKLHPSAESLLNELWPHIVKSEWDVVAQLAVHILGANVEDGSDDFLALLVQRAVATEAESDRTAVLSFACRALQFVVPAPPVLRAIVDAAVDHDCVTYQQVPELRRVQFSWDMAHARPVGYLTRVTAENLKLTARYFIEAVQRRLEWDEFDERALVLGLYPGVSRTPPVDSSQPVDRQFWEAQALENRKVLAPHIARQKDRYSWVAARLVDEGKMTVADLVRRFGVRSLYDYHQGGEVIEPPVAYKVLHADIQDDAERWPLRGPLIRQLVEVLLTAPMPWLERESRYASISYLHSRRRSDRTSFADQTVRSAAVLLAMPLFELGGVLVDQARPGNPQRDGRGRWELIDYFAERVVTDGRVPRQRSDRQRGRGTPSLALLDLPPEVEVVVAKWLRKSVQAVARPSSHRADGGRTT